MKSLEQLEMGLGAKNGRHGCRGKRRGRATWWFTRMRAVVNQALDWKPAPKGRPEQIYLVLAKSR